MTRYPAPGLAPHHGKGGAIAPRNRCSEGISLWDNFSLSTAFKGLFGAKCLTFRWCALERGRAARASSWLPKEQSPPALKKTTRDEALSAAPDSGVN